LHLSAVAKRELARQVAPRYREARRRGKAMILAEFMAATGDTRKHANRLLLSPPSPTGPIRRPRQRRDGPAVTEALVVAWHAADRVCAKRLVPFLPELVPSLERHGHLVVDAATRAQLLALSSATADRLLRPARTPARGRGATRRGALLKHQVAVRTFAQWDEARPGFMEADLVAHCGGAITGAFLHTLVLTDVATAWTECFALRHRTPSAVVAALDRARQLLPFPLLGFDSDDGGEFLNAELLADCARDGITFTRGRSYHKDDRCFVEQKNGAVVRHLVGYGRYTSERSYRQMTELYRAARPYVNFLQPSMKLQARRPRGEPGTKRRYDQARTPFRRLVASGVLPAETERRLGAIVEALDPVRLLRQIERLQAALWRCAEADGSEATEAAPVAAVRFDIDACASPATPETAAEEGWPSSRRGGWMRQRTRKPLGPRTYRTRPDPFAAVGGEIEELLGADPAQTALAVFAQLRHRHPGVVPDGQLRTLQRRVTEWRARTLLVFDDSWLAQEPLAGRDWPPPLVAAGATITAAPPGDNDSALSGVRA
jgi:hypothetical protein